ncbi:hypothetical protein GGX14DRAFT_596768 [Mycena pura]|uniref:Ubiquitin-like protease family profile domain-containing protein n=1 Tax=Mycena pura TaxID=153505 RepID=A0AAD6UPC1_9AGAR|nr:hypothetical protein GGX14DRAFT_596768 [Mycena pura]
MASNPQVHHVFDEDDKLDSDMESDWPAHEWIGCGKKYQNVPRDIALRAQFTRQVPREIEATLPPVSLSPAGFFSDYQVPKFQMEKDGARDDTNIAFDASEPSFIPANPLDLPLLSSATIQRLDADFGQAWFDGKKSIRIRDPHTGITRFVPLWGGTYASRVRVIARAYALWQSAIFWIYEEHENEEPDEPEWRQRTIEMLSSIPGWEGSAPGPDGNLHFESLTELLGENPTSACIVDALVREIRRRLVLRDGAKADVVLADLEFTEFILGGAADDLGHRGHADLKKYSDLLRSPSRPRHLAFPLHSPPFHWAACMVDLHMGDIRFGDSLKFARPAALFSQLKKWLEGDVGLPKVQIMNNLPCGEQRDSVNCGVIAANTLGHNILGDSVWHRAHARTHRMRAFCILAEAILRSEDEDYTLPLIDINPTSSPQNDVDMADTAASIPPPVSCSPQVSEDDIGAILTLASATGQKRSPMEAELTDEESPEPKRPKVKGTKGKTKENDTALALPMVKVEKPKIPEHVQLEILESLRTGGQSATAKHDRVVAILIKHGLFRGSEARLEKLRKDCSHAGGDPNPGLDINNPKQVVCSRCNKTIQLQALYDCWRFRDHWFNTKKPCKPPKTRPVHASLTSFFKPLAPKATEATTVVVRTPQEFQKFCPGLTGAIHARIDYYIDNCPATGGGARQINFYVEALFHDSDGITTITDPDLTLEQRKAAYARQALDRGWRIETSPQRASVVSTRCLVKFSVFSAAAVDDPKVVCRECWAVYIQRTFRTAINRNRDKTHAQAKCTPKLYSNPIHTRLALQYEGLTELLSERSGLGVFARFARGVSQGQYKDNKVFMGIVETMVLATERRIRGVGMQNFKYPTEFREFGALIRMSSPRTYRVMAQHLRMETERSIKHRTAQRPRFPIGITPETFGFLEQYCRDYGYPISHPLCISVDDTKLFAAMQPLHDAREKVWYLLGLPGDQQLKVASPEELEKLMDQKHNPATKLRLWAAQIPFPGVPPLALAILPIASTIKGPALATYQHKLFDGLVEHKYRFISNVADGAAVERDVQARVADASTLKAYTIKPPKDIAAPAISVPLYAYKGNVFINTQDASHSRKTARNNTCSGARALILGDYIVHYQQLYNLAVNATNSPLYEKDIVGYDKQDDNAANRLFSSAALLKLTENANEYMGLIIYLYVFGEMADAYESRTMNHKQRAKAVIGARVFLATWKASLQKMGYSLARYYISHAADKIFHTLIDGLLGLMIIHRDHLPSDIPLLPWKHASMGNEHIFAGLRDILEDFSLVQAINALPRLRATMTHAKQALFAKASFKKVRDGYSLCDLEEDKVINFVDEGEIYGEVIEENHTLWALLHLDTWTLESMSTPTIIPTPVDAGESSDHLTEDDLTVNAAKEDSSEAAVLQLGIGDELDAALAAVQHVSGLRKEEEAEVDACAYAAAALVVDNLAKLDDLPELLDPEGLKQCRKDIACVIKLTPDSILNLLNSLKASFGAPAPVSDRNTTSVLADVTISDLKPFVDLRECHQTDRARKGVKTYKPNAKLTSTTGSESIDAIVADSSTKPKNSVPSERQQLARRVQAIMRTADKRKGTAGLARKARTQQSEAVEEPAPAGNSANAAVAAQGRANEILKRRRTASKKLQCSSIVSEANINHLTPLQTDGWVFAIDRGELILGQVITLYSKGCGKGGRHDWVSRSTNIGEVSYAVARTYEHSGGRSFRRIHQSAAILGLSTFAHLPSGAIIVRVPDGINLTERSAEVSKKTIAMFTELQREKAGLIRMVTVLTTVQRKSGANINVLDLEEDDGIAD